jgi:hypothetical protein
MRFSFMSYWFRIFGGRALPGSMKIRSCSGTSEMS